MYTSLGKSKMYFNDAGTRSIKLSAVKQLLAWPKHFLLRLIRFESGIQNMPQNACKSKPGAFTVDITGILTSHCCLDHII